MLARELKPGQLFAMTETGYVFICLSNNGSISIFPIFTEKAPLYEGFNPDLNWEYGVEGHKQVFLVEATFFLNGKSICA